MRKILEQDFQTRVRTYWIPFQKELINLILTPEFGQTIDRKCSNILQKSNRYGLLRIRPLHFLMFLNKLLNWTCRQKVILIFRWPISYLTDFTIIVHPTWVKWPSEKEWSFTRPFQNISFRTKTPFRMFEKVHHFWPSHLVWSSFK